MSFSMYSSSLGASLDGGALNIRLEDQVLGDRSKVMLSFLNRDMVKGWIKSSTDYEAR